MNSTKTSRAQSAIEFFRTDVQHYESLHYRTTRSHMTVRLECVLKAIRGLQLPARSRVLDVGCGPGFLLLELANQEFDAWGLDTSPPMLQRARQLAATAKLPRLPLQAASLESLPFKDRTFDLVCSTGVLEYLPSDDCALNEVFRVLNPGGYAVVTVTNARSPAVIFEPVIEWLKRRRTLTRVFNRFWTSGGRVAVRPRNFPVRLHAASELCASVRSAGFELVRGEFFYVLPWPHPLDRMFPRATAAVGNRLEFLSKGPLGGVAEGYMVVCRKCS